MKADLNALKEFLRPEEKKYFYKPGAFISYEEIETIREMPGANRKFLAPSSEGNRPWTKESAYHYSIEDKCSTCGRLYVIEHLSKTGLLDALRQRRECSDCREKKREEWEESRERAARNRREGLETFLSPAYSFPEEVRPSRKYGILCEYLPYSRSSEARDAAEKLKALSYSDFLETSYWDAVASEVRRRAKWKCSLCGGSSTLNVHHKTYVNHGYEAYHLEDLICLCRKCHSKFHGKEIE